MVFAGVELEEHPDQIYGLEQKTISLERYAYCKHIGSYHLIRQAMQSMEAEIERQGLELTLPYIEIYGHWTNEESKLETELLMAIKN